MRKEREAGPKGAVVGDGGSFQGFKVYIPAMRLASGILWLLPIQMAVSFDSLITLAVLSQKQPCNPADQTY